MKLSLLRGRNSVAIMSFTLLSSLIGKPVFALPGETGGCTAPPEGVKAANNGPLTCNFTRATLTGTSTTPGTTFTWAGTGNVAGFTASGASVTVTAPGLYILTATNPSTGCTTTASTTVIQTLTIPTGVTASHVGALTCSNNNVPLSGSSTSVLTDTYAWTGPNGFTAQGTSATANAPGVYTITATYTPTGCTASASTTVSRILTAPGNVTAVASSSLNCTHASVTLIGSSNNSGATYTWTGPDGFAASGSSVTTNTVGTYTLTAANSSSAPGCTAATTITVVQDLTAPSGVAATASGTLGCTNSVTLTGTSAASGDNFTWAGPSGFSATGATATATVPGTYTVTAINTSSGCTATASTTVTQNTTGPASPLVTSNPVNALLTCSTSSIGFTASSSALGATYSWTGPNGFTATGQTTTVMAPGTYTVTATDSTTGCSSTSSAVVTQDTARPSSVITNSVPANSQLTCSISNVVLTGSSTTAGVTYSWTGPSGFTANTASATVTIPGNYTVTAINRNNGCTTSVTAPTVTQNTTVPGGVSASVADRLTCNTLSVKISGSSTTTGVTYAWAGPNGFTSALKETFVSVGGVYTLTATDPSNGCSFSRQITVQADQVHPGGVNISSDGSLSCTVGNVTLTGGSSTPNVDYTWTGPNGFFDPEQITSVTDSGTYLLTVHSSSNGCNTTASIVVTADFTGCSAVIRKATNGHAATLDVSGGSATGLSSGLIYKVYPNPASSTAFVELQVPGSDHVSVEVYNGVGVRERILFDGNVEAGAPYRWALDAGSLSAGVHYCMIRTKNKVYVSKLLITPGRRA